MAPRSAPTPPDRPPAVADDGVRPDPVVGMVRAVPFASLRVAPWNPRRITKERFANLCETIRADPGMMWTRPLLAMADGTVYAGNMRLRAVEALGPAWRRATFGADAVPAVVDEVRVEEARARAIRDNEQWGDYETDALAEMLYGMGRDGADMTHLGIEEARLMRILGAVSGVTPPPEGGPPAPGTVTCPSCGTVFPVEAR